MTTSMRRAAALLAAAALLVLTAPAASAHDVLVSTQPAADAALPAPPAQVVVELNKPPVALGAQIEVEGPDGAALATGEPVLVDTTVSVTLPEGSPAGDYAVRWRVTSSDGHPISGEFAFSAAAAAPASSAPVTPSDVPPPTPEETTATADDAPSPSPSSTDATGTAAAATGSGPSTGAVVGGALGVLVLAAGLLALLRRRGSGGQGSSVRQ